MRWPWQDRETRAALPYTDAVVSAILNAAGGGGGTANPEAMASLEMCAGLWGRSFASAKLEPEGAAEAVTPVILGLLGRELVREGEAVFEIRVTRGRLQLLPVCDWSVTGGPDPASWTYLVTAAGPSSAETREVVAARVVHVRYATAPAEPWRGLAPLQVARNTAALASMLELRLAQEVRARVGTLIPAPRDDEQLRKDLANLAGNIALVDSMAGNWDGGRDAAPRGDWAAKRLGANPPAIVDTLRSSTAKHVLAACGVHPSLLGLAATDGTALRESWRQFLHATLAPVARGGSGGAGRQAGPARGSILVRQLDGIRHRGKSPRLPIPRRGRHGNRGCGSPSLDSSFPNRRQFTDSVKSLSWRRWPFAIPERTASVRWPSSAPTAISRAQRSASSGLTVRSTPAAS